MSWFITVLVSFATECTNYSNLPGMPAALTTRLLIRWMYIPVSPVAPILPIGPLTPSAPVKPVKPV